jgi:hypothetical protein
MNYYEKVRDAIEEIAECTTSDAQGILGAWELRDPRRFTSIEKAESARVTPKRFALAVLGMAASGMVSMHLHGKYVGERAIEHVRYVAQVEGLMVIVNRSNGYSHDWTELITMEQWERDNAHEVGAIICHLVASNTKTGTTHVSFS